MVRRNTRSVFVRGIEIGGGSKISVQSMLNTKTEDAKASLAQINALKNAGCDIVRLTVNTEKAAQALAEIRRGTDMPLVADIHFDYRLALASIEAGVDKIRINPGNIGRESRVRAVADACKANGIPIRIGVNSGSLEREILDKYGAPCAAALAESALGQASQLEKMGFYDTVISVKSSDVITTVEAYEILAAKCDYPLHIGVTEAGTEHMGLVKSCAGIGSLLCHGIGDTLRVSLTADPVKEVQAGIDLLRALGIRRDRPTVVSCPTCGRTCIDIISLAHKVEEAVKDIEKPIKIAVMGCAVNGPGEARDADIGIAGGIGEGLIFEKDRIIGKVPEDKLLDTLLEIIRAK